MGIAAPVRGQERPRVEVALERLWPAHADRQITTTSLDLLWGGARQSPWLSWRAGVTATRADGYIVQFDEHFEGVRLESPAWGLGPTGLLRAQTPEWARTRIELVGSGSLVLYTRRFPAGGDIYDFMWRGGPALEIRAGRRLSVGASLLWMHVSNGQGLRPINPAYNARGLSLWVARPR